MSVQASGEGVAGRVRELVSGIDAFNFSGKGELPGPLTERLAEAREAAADVQVPTLIEFGGEEFAVLGRGQRQYPWQLVHPFGQIGLLADSAFPAVWVQPRAVALHGLGAREAVAWLERVVAAEVPGVVFSPSRVDLFCDVQGWVPTPSTRLDMVCRAKRRITREHGDDLTGLEFGKRGSKAVFLRLYDKSREVFEQGHDHWYPIWGERFDPTLAVWRIEFEVGQRRLAEFGASTIDEAFALVPSIWARMTDEEFRLTQRTGDQTKCRRPTDPIWTHVQRATLRADAVPAVRLIEAARQGTLRKLRPQLSGVLSSVGAMTDATTLDAVLDRAHDLVLDHETWTGRRFMDRVEEKRRR